MNIKLHHIGIAVKSISEASAEYSILGFQNETEIVHDKIRNINILFMISDGTRIELIEKADDMLPSPIDNCISPRQHHSIYHSCYIVDNLEASVKKFVARHYIILKEPEIAPALNEKRVVFLFHRNIGTIELLEQ